MGVFLGGSVKGFAAFSEALVAGSEDGAVGEDSVVLWIVGGEVFDNVVGSGVKVPVTFQESANVG